MSDAAKMKNLMKPARAAQFKRAAEELGKRIGVTGAMAFPAAQEPDVRNTCAPGSFMQFTNEFPEYAVYIFDGPGNCCYSINMEGGKCACLFYDRRLERFHYAKTPDPYCPKKIFCCKCAKFFPIESYEYHECGESEAVYELPRTIREHRKTCRAQSRNAVLHEKTKERANMRKMQPSVLRRRMQGKAYGILQRYRPVLSSLQETC